MKIRFILLIAVFCFSFRPSTEKAALTSSNGFYVFVEDFTDRTKQSYIVQSRDSVDIIFQHFFESELELGEVNRPLTIYNGEHDFYVARVNVFHKSNGKLGFNSLKYPKIKMAKRHKLKPVIL